MNLKPLLRFVKTYEKMYHQYLLYLDSFMTLLQHPTSLLW